MPPGRSSATPGVQPNSAGAFSAMQPAAPLGWLSVPVVTLRFSTTTASACRPVA